MAPRKPFSTRRAYTVTEDRMMWRFFIKRFRQGEVYSSNRMWEAFRREHFDDLAWRARRASGIESHFRKRLVPRLLNCPLRGADLFNILSFYKFAIGNSYKKSLEEENNVSITLNPHDRTISTVSNRSDGSKHGVFDHPTFSGRPARLDVTNPDDVEDSEVTSTDLSSDSGDDDTSGNSESVPKTSKLLRLQRAVQRRPTVPPLAFLSSPTPAVPITDPSTAEFDFPEPRLYHSNGWNIITYSNSSEHNQLALPMPTDGRDAMLVRDHQAFESERMSREPVEDASLTHPIHQERPDVHDAEVQTVTDCCVAEVQTSVVKEEPVNETLNSDFCSSQNVEGSGKSVNRSVSCQAQRKLVNLCEPAWYNILRRNLVEALSSITAGRKETLDEVIKKVGRGIDLTANGAQRGCEMVARLAFTLMYGAEPGETLASFVDGRFECRSPTPPRLSPQGPDGVCFKTSPVEEREIDKNRANQRNANVKQTPSYLVTPRNDPQASSSFGNAPSDTMEYGTSNSINDSYQSTPRSRKSRKNTR